jgi:hypothetical protein
VLAAWEGLDGAELAAALGCSRAAAKAVRPHRVVLVAVVAWAALIAALALFLPRGLQRVSPAQALLQKAADTAGQTGPPRQIPAARSGTGTPSRPRGR